MRFGAGDGEALIDAAKTSGVPLTVVDITDQDIDGLYERRLVLVRPDGHVAWRGDELPRNANQIVDCVRGAVARLG